MRNIAIFGATGNVGGKVVAQLPATGVRVRAVVRRPDTARMPQHIEVAYGDLTRPETLDRCLDGIDTVFLVWVAPQDAVVPAIAKIAKHVQNVVLLSAPLKTDHPLFQQPNPSRTRAELIERTIEDSGLHWTFLRPGMFASNALGWWTRQMRGGGVVRWPHVDVPTAPIDERDIASVAVRALCEDGHSGAEYVLTGPQSLSQAEQIETLGTALGRSLRVEAISPDDWLKELPEGLPPFVAQYLLDAWAAAAGQPAFVTSTVADITGSPARTFLEWARSHADQLQG